MQHYPKVRSVEPIPRKRLRVSFEDGSVRIYDCKPLLEEPAFRHLNDDAFFRNVRPDPHGYGVAWNDDTDLAESELWLGGYEDESVHGSEH